MLLRGAPGAGAWTLAWCLTTIVPAVTLAESLETTRIHRVAGRTGERTAWGTTRPGRAPYQTICDVGWVGGGYMPTPGKVSLAHHPDQGTRKLDCRQRCMGMGTSFCGRDPQGA
jgi:magnesium chelatase family protein